MIEQINIALEQKGPGISPAWVVENLPSEITSKREHIHQLKVMKDGDIPRSSLEQDDIVNSLNYEALQ